MSNIDNTSVKRITSDQTFNNNSTLADLISIPVLPDTSYTFDFLVHHTSNMMGGVKLGYSSSLSNLSGIILRGDGSTSVTTIDPITESTTSFGHTPVNTTSWTRFSGSFLTSSTARKFAIQGAQNSASAMFSTVFKRGGFLILTRIDT